MPGIGPSRNRQRESSGIAQFGQPDQPALPDIIPYPSSDPYIPYEVYNARNYRVNSITGMSALSDENKNTLVFGLVIGIPIALIIWNGMRNKPRGY
jgi:hypothetical protein